MIFRRRNPSDAAAPLVRSSWWFNPILDVYLACRWWFERRYLFEFDNNNNLDSFRSCISWPPSGTFGYRSPPAKQKSILLVLLSTLTDCTDQTTANWPLAVPFLESLGNFELKIVSAWFPSVIIVTVALTIYPNTRLTFWYWFWQFLVYYSYVDGHTHILASFGMSCKLWPTSCIDAARGCIQEVHADATNILDKKYQCWYSYVDILRVGTGTNARTRHRCC